MSEGIGELTELVARALCEHAGGNPDEPMSLQPAGTRVPHWTAYQVQALVALKAIGEPTDSMARRGAEYLNLQPRTAAGAWRAMIKVGVDG